MRRAARNAPALLGFEPFVKLADMLMNPAVDDKLVLELVQSSALFQTLTLQDVDFFVPQIA
jgi:hypothetical protein